MVHLMLMTHLAGNRSVGLCYRLSEWFYMSGKWAFNGLREMKNFGYNFSCKFIPETAVENLQKWGC